MATTTQAPEKLIAGRVRALPQSAVVMINIAIIVLWLWLYRPIFDYLAIIFTREDFRTNQLVLLGVVLLIASQLRKGHLRPRIDLTPQLYLPALILALGGSVFYLIVERFLDVNTLSASLFGLATFGLTGLWMTPRRWRQGFLPALLLIGALPFGEHMQTFIGYPLRLLTAAIVRDGLAAAGVGSVGIDTILVFENGVSQVDLPCSGVKSLWTGMLFLLAATWIERRPLNIRWFLIAIIFAMLLLVANLARVCLLVAAGQVAGWQLAAEMIHVPLGVIGFVAACLAALVLLRLQESPTSTGSPSSNYKRPIWLAPSLAITILFMAIIYTPRPQTGLAQAPPTWSFPAELIDQPMPLKPDEFRWLAREGAESADRRRFEWRGISGTMILITSKTWRAHHRPERCFEVYGLSMDDSRIHLVSAGFPVRYVSLGDGRDRDLFSATYWFQSAEQSTDDYSTRIWADLALQRDRWVLVSILFDGLQNPQEGDTQAFYLALHNSVQRYLEGGTSS
jgi:exosortase O